MSIALIFIIIILAIRLGWKNYSKTKTTNSAKTKSIKPLPSWKIKLFTVWVFFVVNLKRLFRDRVALFFSFLFPLIFLFVFGSLSSNSQISMRISLINESGSAFSKLYVKQLESDKVFNINKSIHTLAQANQEISRGEIDANVILPPNFGKLDKGIPHGKAIVQYNRSNQQAGQTLISLLQNQFNGINNHFVSYNPPFKVTSEQSNAHSLTSFDYTFTGLIGFAILGAGIFGPMNVFPELKKMGILRRLHTTPLKVWQFFLSNMLVQAVSGLLSVALMLVVAIALYHLKIVGNLAELAIFISLGIFLILGIGLALGGWAKNERQVAPLGNIIVFPMMFLTGVFFPRFLMPQWLQSITTYMPLTPVIDGSRMILTEGKGLLDLGPQLLVMGIWLIIVYAIAFRVFRWE